MSHVRFSANTLTIAARRVIAARAQVAAVVDCGQRDSFRMVLAVQALNVAIAFEEVARRKVVHETSLAAAAL